MFHLPLWHSGSGETSEPPAHCSAREALLRITSYNVCYTKLLRAEELNLEIAIDAENSILEITIEDGGAGFDVVHSVREPNVDSEQGRGLILVRAFSHDVVS